MDVLTLDIQFLGLDRVIATYVLRGAGRVVLVDPGPASCLSALRAGLSARGLALGDVTDVLLTHIHFDHAGAAWAFAEAGATVHVHPVGERHLRDPSRLWDSAARIYGDDNMAQLWGEMRPIDAGQLQTWTHEQGARLGTFDVVAYHTPGHAKHHIAWRVGDVLFLGDVGGIQIGDGPVEAPCPPPDIDVPAWHNSLAILRGLDGVRAAYQTHFGLVTPAESWRDALAATGRSLDRWVEAAQEVLKLPEEAQDQAFVTLIEDERAPYPTADAYALANPAHMTLNGLRQYLASRDGGSRGC